MKLDLYIRDATVKGLLGQVQRYISCFFVEVLPLHKVPCYSLSKN